MGYQTRPHRRVFAVALNVAMAASPCFGDDIGLSAFQADTNNAYLGQGIVVAQPEAAFPTFEIDPAAAGVAVPVTYIYLSDGTSGGYINTTTLTANYTSGHADAVAGNLAGTIGGVAPNLRMLLNYDADLYVNHYVLENLSLVNSPKVINQSFIETTNSTFSEPILDQFFDNYVAQHNYIICTAAGNGGDIQPPGTAYNVITVGAYGGASSVSRPGQLCKPDIVAPASATSYATPYVSGAAALLVQVAGSGDGTNPSVVKSLLLNGATIPSGWSHTPTQPLDRTYGAGILNIDGSYRNLIGGETHASMITYTSLLGGAHAPASTPTAGAAGWDLGSLTSTSTTDAVANYVVDLSQDTSIFNFTATVTWQRANDTALTSEYLANINNSNFTNFTSSIYTINNLDLYLYNVATGQQVDLSNSAIDNVEHLVTVNLPPGKYDLQVLKNGGAVGTANVFSNSQTYGLAWNAGNQTSISNTSNLVFSQTNSATISTVIAGTGTITQSSPGTTTLTNYLGTGAVGVSLGTLSLAKTTATRGTAAVLVTIDGLTMNSGTVLDLTNHDAIITGASFSTINSLIAAGLGHDVANSPAIIASNSQVYGGSGDNAVLVPLSPSLLSADGITSWDGVSIPVGATLVIYTFLGDSTLEGIINGEAYAAVTSNFGLTTPGYADIGTSWTMGDMALEGVVNGDDYAAITSAFGQSPAGMIASTGVMPGLAVGAANAPEPGTWFCLGLGLAGFLLRRRRNVASHTPA